jgi:hypothetical protein
VDKGWICGRVLPAGTHDPTFELWRDGEAVEVPLADSDSPAPGRFDIGPLSPGVYSLTCGFPWSEDRARIDGIHVVAGRREADPRLDPLDLRDELPAVALTIVDQDGRSVPDPVISLPRAASGELMRISAAHEGEHWLVLAIPPASASRLPASVCRSSRT